MAVDLSAEKLIEEGIGLIAQGAFRQAQTDPAEAEAQLHAVLNTITSMHIDFMRKSKTVGGQPI